MLKSAKFSNNERVVFRDRFASIESCTTTTTTTTATTTTPHSSSSPGLDRRMSGKSCVQNPKLSGLQFPLTQEQWFSTLRECVPAKPGKHPKSLYSSFQLLLELPAAKFYTATMKSRQHEQVVVKKIRNREDPYEQSLVENEALCSLLSSGGPNILTYYDTHKTAKNTWVVMQFVDGCNLEQLYPRVTLKEEHVAYVTKCLVDALVWLHEKCRTHRDLKPSNVMVDKQGSVLLMDFGFAVQFTTSKPTDNTSAGTLLYMAPEVALAHNYQCQPDIWSLGITVFELLTTHHPLSGVPIPKVASRIVNEPPPRLPNVFACSDDARDLVHLCLDKDMSKRPTAQMLLQHPFLRRACSPQQWLDHVQDFVTPV